MCRSCNRVVVVLGLAFLALSAPLANADLINRYSFDGADAIAVDSIGGKNGAIYNGTQSGGSVALSGSSDSYVNLPAHMLPTSGNATVEMWYTQTDSTLWTGFWAFGNQVDGEGRSAIAQQMRRDWAGNKVFAIDANGNQDYMENTSGVPSLNEEHLFSTVYDFDGRTMSYYVDGGLIGSTPLSYVTSLSQIVDNVSWIGKPLWADHNLIGSVTEFRLFNRALTESQIAAEFAAGPDQLTSAAVPEPGTVTLSSCGVFGLLAYAWRRRR